MGLPRSENGHGGFAGEDSLAEVREARPRLVWFRHVCIVGALAVLIGRLESRAKIIVVRQQ